MSGHPLSAAALCDGFDVPDFVVNFDAIPGGGVVFGPGTLASIGHRARELGATRALLVTDPGIARSGHSERCVGYLQEAGVQTFVFDGVHENPTTVDVGRTVAFAADKDVDLIVGIGGGSSMDTAKGCNFLLTNGGEMRDYWGVGKATKPMLPLIAVPTTSGTGSECQSFALIADDHSHAKMACGDKKAAAAVAILDPELTLTQPRAVTAHTGIDAIAHALETAVCRKCSDVSLAYSRAAWQLLEGAMERVLTHPEDIEARARMQLGAAFAGTAIENSMLGIAHSCANPLTAHFDIVHGQAVGTMLPWVIGFNRADASAAETYDSLWSSGLEKRVRELLQAAEMDLSVGDLGANDESLVTLAEEAAGQWTAQFNPVPVEASDLAGLYQSAW